MITTINFKVRNKPHSWRITHNLDEYGLSIDAAFVNWSARTDKVDPELFAAYVVSKDPEFLKCKVEVNK